MNWNRDTCERCRMMVSEPDFAAQVRYFTENNKSKVATFDDIGCAALWLQESPWSKDERTEIWVVDHRNKEWINARTATFIPDRITPMNYGLGAQSDPGQYLLSMFAGIQTIDSNAAGTVVFP